MRGSVYKRGASWCYVVDVGRNPATGRRRQVKKSGFPTKRAAQHALSAVLKDVQQATYVPPSNQTVAEFLGEWVPAAKGSVGTNTWAGFQIMTSAYVIPRIGAMKLSELTPLRLRTFYNELQASGGRGGRALSATTVHNVHRFLRRALRDAELPINPVAKTAPPKVAKRRVEVWNAETMRAFLGQAEQEGHLDYVAWTLLAATGMRRSEVLRLRWQDVDFEAESLSIEVSKSAAGSRRVALDKKTLDLLRRRRGLGTIVSKVDPSLFSKRFSEAVRRWGLPPLTMHGLRHSHASMLLAAGVHPKVVSERLGHSSIQITLDLYSHLIPGIQEAAAHQVGGLLWSQNGHVEVEECVVSPLTNSRH